MYTYLHVLANRSLLFLCNSYCFQVTLITYTVTLITGKVTVSAVTSERNVVAVELREDCAGICLQDLMTVKATQDESKV